MVTWRDVVDQAERRAEAIRQAEAWRLSQVGRLNSQGKPSRVAALTIRVGSRLGQWMERTGCRLQARFKMLEQQAVLNGPSPSATMRGCP
jgi:hypothetical protein